MASVVYPTQGVRERARVFETLNFFLKRPDVAVLCAFPGNTACSCFMSATGAPSKALKVRPSAAHSVIFPRGVVHRVENRWGLTKVAVVLLNGLI